MFFYHLEEFRASGRYANQAKVRKGWPNLRAIMIERCVKKVMFRSSADVANNAIMIESCLKKSCFGARLMSQKEQF